MKTTWTDEEWKPCPSHEDKYEVSNRGRVKRKAYSVDINTSDGRSWTQTYEPKIMEQWGVGGYQTVNLSVGDGEHKTRYVHRLVLKAFVGTPPTPDHECNHVDGDKENNCVSNLEWTTHQENITHAAENGLQNSDFGRTKVPAEDIPMLRQRQNSGEITHRELAEEYGVRTTYMIQLLNGSCAREVQV